MLRTVHEKHERHEKIEGCMLSSLRCALTMGFTYCSCTRFFFVLFVPFVDYAFLLGTCVHQLFNIGVQRLCIRAI